MTGTTRYTYLAAPRTSDKEELIDLGESNLIDGLDEFKEAAMGQFTQAVKPGGASL